MVYRQDDPLTQLSASDLAGLLAKREVSSEEVVRAHLDRIITIDGRIGAFVEVLRGEAMAGARASDEARRRGDALGPLAGLPATVKENLDYEGRASTLGIIARKHHVAARDATIVRALKRAGAIVLGRTNVPQLLLSHESRNPLFGFTKNPWSEAHAPGGSSGGEAAAIASGQSPLGIGTDIGGSIRVPAAWCGISGLKPTLDRWSNRGSNGALVGQETIRSQCGPMARSARDVAFLFRALDPRQMAEDDPLVPPLPIGDPEAVDVSRLRVGYFVDDGLIAPSESVGRAVQEAAVALERAGVKVVPFSPPGIKDALALYFSVMSADGGETAFAQLAGTTTEPTLLPLRKAAALPGAVRGGLARTLRTVGESRAGWFLSQVGVKSVAELWRLTKAARDYRLTLLAAMRREGVDVLLCPVHATAAVPHGMSAQFTLAGSGSMLFNLVQFPAGVVPVTSVRADELTRPRPQGRADRFEATAAEVERQSQGLPLGVQLAAPPFHDETVLAVMIALERSLAGKGVPVTPRFGA